MSNVNCAVAACSNTRGKCPNLSFYSFPATAHFRDQRNKWIAAIRRNRHDGTPWEPSIYSRICSSHFLQGKKSSDPRSPSYVPTIFPAIYKKKCKETSLDRYKRLINRNNTVLNNSSIINAQDYDPNYNTENNVPNIDSRDDTQVFPAQPETPTTFKTSIATQTDISTPLNAELIIKFPVETKDISTNTIDLTADNRNNKSIFLHCHGFHGYNTVKNDASALKDLLGVSDEVFKLLLEVIGEYITSNKKYKVTIEDRLIIFLLKLKHGLTYSAIRVLFNIHRTTVASIFKEMLLLIYQRTSQPSCNFIPWPTKEQVVASMPECFKLHYSKCRVIIDCTEVRAEVPPGIENKVYLYSAYKGYFTFKFLIGIAPCGAITFKSDAYGGRSSDSGITVDTDLVSLLEPDDEVMADKGFPEIVNKLKEDNVVVVMPPFNLNGQLTKEEVKETKKIARVRIHVERAISRIKIFDILKSVPHELFSYIDEIMHVCCVLVNLMPPIIRDGELDTS